MKIFLRTFSNRINSKSGTLLPEGQYRGTPEWMKFQEILINCLENLSHKTYCQPENINFDDWRYDPRDLEGTPYFDKKIYVHQTKREKPEGNLFWMQMHFRELFTIDTNGWGADHSGNNLFNPNEISQEEATNFCEEKSRNLLASGQSKCEQPERTSETPRGFILVPVQIPRDYTIKHHSPITVRYFIESVQSWAIETETQVCFKMHPFNKVDKDLEAIIDEAAASSTFVTKVEGNINTLINRSSGVMVINSGTGFESLVHGKPVVTFGNCDYKPVTFNGDIIRINEARHFIINYKEEWKQLGYKFIYWYFKYHAYDVNDESTPNRLKEYLKCNL